MGCPQETETGTHLLLLVVTTESNCMVSRAPVGYDVTTGCKKLFKIIMVSVQHSCLFANSEM